MSSGGVQFYLGTHRPSWLGRLDVPLFVSIRTLRERPAGGRALAPWAMDSGGYTELSKHAGWATPAAAYAEEIERHAERVGELAWAAPQDWICAPPMLAATGLSIDEHIDRTVASVVELRGLVRGVHVAAMLQGWTLADYLRCVELYAAAGIDLAGEPVVGLGSIAGRQASPEVAWIVRQLAAGGLRLHGFGVKVRGWQAFGDVLASADSMAWSFDARRSEPLAGCTHRGRCANCQRYALRWREDLLARPRGTGPGRIDTVQVPLFG